MTQSADAAVPLLDRLAMRAVSAWGGGAPHPGRGGRVLAEAVAPLPVPGVDAALVLLVEERSDGTQHWLQCLPCATADGDIGDGLAEPAVRRWLHEALLVGHRLVAGAWVWDATPERGVAGAAMLARCEGSMLDGERDAAIVRSDAATLTIPHRVDPDDLVALELVRRLAAGDGAPIVAAPLAAARWIGPGGLRLPAMLLAALPGTARPAIARLRPLVARALHEVPEAVAASLLEAQALGTVARELHAALGRPVAEGLGSAAIPATRRDVEAWALEAADALAALERGLRPMADAARPHLAALRAHLPAIVAAAGRDPGLVHRIHGAFDLEAVRLLDDGAPRITGFGRAPTIGSPSPWHDVAALLVSLTRLAGDAAGEAGGTPTLLARAWAWEREARRAALDGYGPAGGAAHALVALFEIPLVAQQLLATQRDAPTRLAPFVHALDRLAHAAV